MDNSVLAKLLANPALTEEQRKDIIIRHIYAADNNRILRSTLPFLYGKKHYKWSKAFFESKNKFCMLTAANQIGKSTVQIRKAINWATDRDLWKELWVTEPNLFWYLYPTQDVVNIEFELKWKAELPKGVMKDDPKYGWEEMKSGKDITGIKFKSGVILLFKTYAQNVHALQSSTVYAIFTDEELPIELFDELQFRLSASDGYFNMVFTATRGQDEWRRAMEPESGENEFLPQAFKQTVSLYDCQFYEDGTPSQWTIERIKEREMRCSTHNEVLKRIHGKFVLDSGSLVFESFDFKRHIKKAHPIPKSWLIYSGSDIGSGGERGHPSAITFVAVSPDFTEGRVFLGWRGDKIITTAADVVEKNLLLKKQNNINPTRQFYDWASKDFFNIAQSMGESFEPADKDRNKGIDLINALFKNDMLYIYDTDELRKLTIELGSLKKDTKKNKAADDFCDSLRYALSSIPWDFAALSNRFKDKEPEQEVLSEEEESVKRRREYWERGRSEDQRIEDEFEEWNSLY